MSSQRKALPQGRGAQRRGEQHSPPAGIGRDALDHAGQSGPDLRPERWPADRAAFEEYWTAALATVRIDDTVREHLDQIAELRHLPRPLRVLFGPMHRFIAAGYLPPPFREQMRVRWTARQQRRFDRMIRTTAFFVRVTPRPVRRFPFNAVLWDLRRRIRTGRPLV